MLHCRRIVLAGICATYVGSCSVVESAAELVELGPALELIGLGPELPCDVDRYEAKRMSGAYYQIADGSAGGRILHVTGRVKPKSAPVPRNLLVDDSKIRAISPGDDGVLMGWRKSVATPIASLNNGEVLPLAYTLSYRVNAADFTGPLVVGIPPRQEEIPQLGLTIMTGFVELTRTTFTDDGTQAVTNATGRFEMRFGFGSGRAEFRVANIAVNDGPALPFETMSWSRLGICGARLVSSGQGVLKLRNKGGDLLPVFGDWNDPTAGTLAFEASMFAGDTRPGPPGRVGGIFAIQGDNSSISGVFLSSITSNTGGS